MKLASSEIHGWSRCRRDSTGGSGRAREAHVALLDAGGRQQESANWVRMPVVAVTLVSRAASVSRGPPRGVWARHREGRGAILDRQRLTHLGGIMVGISALCWVACPHLMPRQD